MSQDKSPATFEEAYEKLRKLVEELESGALPLDGAMARYEEGMRLARLCNDILDKAELRIQRVTQELSGEPPRGPE